MENAQLIKEPSVKVDNVKKLTQLYILDIFK